MKTLCVAALALLPLIPFTSFSHSAPCETLGKIKITPSSAPPMTSVEIISKVTNCSPLPKTYHVIGVETSECGDRLTVGDGEVSLAPGESAPLITSGISAPDTCVKPVTVTIIAFEGDKPIAKVEATISPKTVQ